MPVACRAGVSAKIRQPDFEQTRRYLCGLVWNIEAKKWNSGGTTSLSDDELENKHGCTADVPNAAILLQFSALDPNCLTVPNFFLPAISVVGVLSELYVAVCTTWPSAQGVVLRGFNNTLSLTCSPCSLKRNSSFKVCRLTGVHIRSTKQRRVARKTRTSSDCSMQRGHAGVCVDGSWAHSKLAARAVLNCSQWTFVTFYPLHCAFRGILNN